jgi:hypothetical protein
MFIHVYIHIHTHMYVHTCIYKNINAYAHTHTHTHTHSHIYMYIHIYFMDLCVCVIELVGCVRSQKYTKYKNVQCKILQTFYKNNITKHFTPKKFIYKVQGCVCRYFLKATLKFSMSFLRNVTLGGDMT